VRRHSMHRFPLLGLLGLLASLLSFSSQASTPLERAGALVWDMGDMYWDFGNQHIARGMTPEKVQRLAVKVASKMTSRRGDLAELLPDLDPESRFARDVKRFIEGWPDHQAFQDDLLRHGQGEELGMALSGLKSQVSDPRRGWKTPFPFFRP
jgi:hypothetical protein